MWARLFAILRKKLEPDDARRRADLRTYRKWLIYRQQHGVSNAQLHNDYRQPRTFWNWCLREELTTNNPFAKVEKPKCSHR
jgi:site-specific recombinase XerD